MIKNANTSDRDDAAPSSEDKRIHLPDYSNAYNRNDDIATKPERGIGIHTMTPFRLFAAVNGRPDRTLERLREPFNVTGARLRQDHQQRKDAHPFFNNIPQTFDYKKPSFEQLAANQHPEPPRFTFPDRNQKDNNTYHLHADIFPIRTSNLEDTYIPPAPSRFTFPGLRQTSPQPHPSSRPSPRPLTTEHNPFPSPHTPTLLEDLRT